MQEDDKDFKKALMGLAILGGLIVSSGLAMAAFCYSKRHSIKDAACGFVACSSVVAYSLYYSFNEH